MSSAATPGRTPGCCPLQRGVRRLFIEWPSDHCYREAVGEQGYGLCEEEGDLKAAHEGAVERRREDHKEETHRESRGGEDLPYAAPEPCEGQEEDRGHSIGEQVAIGN